ncbi:MAG: IMPACT family protein [Planctomycetes bacterium]|nr:IMPACT family protein [Planctomycetota bacterium]
MADEYDVLAEEFRHETDPTKGSRFIASLAPATTPEEAETFVARVRTEGPSATHHCWAYRVGRPCDRFRFSDDGEPGGSAGRPILQQIEGHGLTDTACVVTRYYGGTKLGVGGLIRAYGGCAARALDLAPKRVHVVTVALHVAFPYDCSGAVQGLLAARKIEPVSAEYSEEVRMVFEVALRDSEDFERELRDRTAARARIARNQNS